MTFRLKDKNLQVQLDALSDGDFSKRLQHANHDDGMIFVEFGEKLESPGFDLHRFNLAFFDDEVKEIHRYNPHGWNAFPEVEPPEGVWMRCETDVNAIEHKIRHVAKFDGREWRDYLSKQVVVHRFRPWDNPEDEE